MAIALAEVVLHADAALTVVSDILPKMVRQFDQVQVYVVALEKHALEKQQLLADWKEIRIKHKKFCRNAHKHGLKFLQPLRDLQERLGSSRVTVGEFSDLLAKVTDTDKIADEIDDIQTDVSVMLTKLDQQQKPASAKAWSLLWHGLGQIILGAFKCIGGALARVFKCAGADATVTAGMVQLRGGLQEMGEGKHLHGAVGRISSFLKDMDEQLKGIRNDIVIMSTIKPKDINALKAHLPGLIKTCEKLVTLCEAL
jgi:hypothetical protein